MKCSLKWFATMVPIVLVYLALGFQYTIIVPTLWDYMMNRLKGQEWLYSLSLSSTSLMNVFVGPLLGIIYDKTHACKTLVVIGLVCAATGAFMYFAAVSPYMVIAGRMLQGVALATGTVISGEVSRFTTRKERTAVFSMLTAVTQIGYVIGPGFNVVLRYCDFKVGPFVIDEDTSPALFVSIYWFITAFLFLVFYFHLPTVKDEEVQPSTSIIESRSTYSELADKSMVVESTENVSGRSGGYRAAFARNYEVLEIGDNGIARIVPYSRRNSISTSYSSAVRSGVIGDHSIATTATTSEKDSLLKDSSCSQVPPNDSDYSSLNQNVTVETVHRRKLCRRMCFSIRRMGARLLTVISKLVWEEVVLLLFIIFIMIFSEMSVQVTFTPVTQKYFDWSVLAISIFFSIAGALMIGVSVVISLLSNRVGDRWMILVGLVAQLVACLWLLCWFYFINSINNFVVMIQFVIGTTIILLTEPVTLGSGVSLFSKVIETDIQGIGHGVRRSMVSLGSVLGCLWGAIALQLSSTTLQFGGPVGLIVLSIVLTAVTFKKLNR